MIEYVKHDNVLLRRDSDTFKVEMKTEDGWEPFPEPEDRNIRYSSIAAWMEGTKLTEKEAGAFGDGNNKTTD